MIIMMVRDSILKPYYRAQARSESGPWSRGNHHDHWFESLSVSLRGSLSEDFQQVISLIISRGPSPSQAGRGHGRGRRDSDGPQRPRPQFTCSLVAGSRAFKFESSSDSESVMIIISSSVSPGIH